MEEDHYLQYMNNIGPSEMETLIMRYWKDIWNYAYILTKKHDVADDLAQDTFVNAFLSLGQFRGESSVKTWLLRICRNLVINYKRSAFFRRVLPVAAVKPTLRAASAEHVAIANTQVDVIWQHLLSLPEKHREVIVLDIRYGLSISEMAEFLGIVEGTVKSRLHRARATMKKAMEENEA
ncbi:RNA polymerase sigma factor [Paenibacillus sp. GCM10023252]|uniref:RNA polymerase sigma factor n=1 Tax=Paenibacillus sp. GCM10023252 TaxID=3252649 RepID=UPI0036085AC5